MSLQYTIVAPDGEIVGSGICSENQYATLAHTPQHVVFPIFATSETHYFNGTELVEYTAEQAAAKRDGGFYGGRWSDDQMTWVNTLVPDAAKVQKWEAIKAIRESKRSAGFTWNGALFDSDADARANISLAAIGAMRDVAAGVTDVTHWTTADNSIVQLTPQDIVSLAEALGYHLKLVHATGTALRLAVESAQSIEDLEGIDWPQE